jgi:hypothetical protein
LVIQDTASNIFFKTYLGDIAPTVLPAGTMIKVFAQGLVIKHKQKQMKEKVLLMKMVIVLPSLKNSEDFMIDTNYYVIIY